MGSPTASKLLDAFMRGDPGAIDSMKAVAVEKQAALAQKEEDSFKITSFLNNDNASAIKIYDFLNGALGEDWYDWEVETLERMLFIKYGVALEEVNRDKVLAIRHICRSDGCFFDWFEFNQVALSFSGCIAGFDALRNPSPGSVVNAVKTVNHIRPDRNGEFGIDVQKFICIIFVNEGLYICPPSIKSTVGDTMKQFVSTDMQELEPKIIDRYKQILTDRSIILDETVVDIQVRRLLKAEASALEYAQ